MALSKGRIFFDNIETIDQSQFVTGDFQFTQFRLPYDIYVKRVEGSNKLLIMGQGAVDRNRKQLPVYQRKSWLDCFDCNVLILQDPTLYLTPTLRLGWAQGLKSHNPMATFVKIIRKVRTLLDIQNNNVVFFGSSAGGFVSLFLGGYFKGSTVVVNNPQTDIFRYHEAPVRSLLAAGFDGIEFDEYRSIFPSRYSVSKFYEEIQFVPEILYYQNICDTEHLENHCFPFVEGISGLQHAWHNNVDLKLYSDEKSGHNPMSKSKTVSAIKNVLGIL